MFSNKIYLTKSFGNKSYTFFHFFLNSDVYSTSNFPKIVFQGIYAKLEYNDKYMTELEEWLSKVENAIQNEDETSIKVSKVYFFIEF